MKLSAKRKYTCLQPTNEPNPAKKTYHTIIVSTAHTKHIHKERDLNTCTHTHTQTELEKKYSNDGIF